jgi:hypothetical protein
LDLLMISPDSNVAPRGAAFEIVMEAVQSALPADGLSAETKGFWLTTNRVQE